MFSSINIILLLIYIIKNKQFQAEHRCAISGNQTSSGIVNYILLTSELLKLGVLRTVRKLTKYSQDILAIASSLTQLQVICSFGGRFVGVFVVLTKKGI